MTCGDRGLKRVRAKRAAERFGTVQRGQTGTAGYFEGDARLGESAFGTDDALGYGGLGDQESARDFLCGQAAQQTKREGRASFFGEDGMTRDEDEAQKIVVDFVVTRDF